ncbi:MAG: hypothetical protein JRI96_09655 [Deltaproteobacteria bacterium]|nr:hypothetical protein [Deltaproteobacteria bacterium]
MSTDYKTQINARKPEMETKVEEVIEKCVQFIVEKCGNGLEALVLVGSFSRGEGIVYPVNGKLKFLSDVEFWAVAKVSEFASLRVQRVGIEKEIEKHLKEQGVDVEVTVGITTKKHLQRFKPCIFTVETKRFGRVLWGDKNILDYLPIYLYEEINPIDGFILLNNRIVEQLILLNKINSEEAIYQYDIDRGYIQIVNSLLAFHRRYRSLRKQKKDEFSRLFAGMDYLKENASGLPTEVEHTFDYLNNSDGKALSKDEALSEWKELRNYFKEVWLYEAATLVGNKSYGLKELIKKFVSIPDFKSRIKGWVKVLVDKRCSILDARYSMRDLFRTSPQFLIYRQAVQAYFGNETDRAKIQRITQKWEIIVK